jgi:hypothetical protein
LRLCVFAISAHRVHSTNHVRAILPNGSPPANLTINKTTIAASTMINDTATADSNFPTESSKNTVVGKTSVLIRVAPANTRIGPNSPIARAHAIVPAVSIPCQASGITTRQNACPRVHPNVNATCSDLGEI